MAFKKSFDYCGIEEMLEKGKLCFVEVTNNFKIQDKTAQIRIRNSFHRKNFLTMAFRFEFMTLTSEKSTQILSNKLLQIHLAFMQLISRKLMTKVCHCATIKVGKLFQFQTLKLFSLVLLLCLHP